MRDEPSGYEEALAYITERNNGWINSTAARVLVGEVVWLGRFVDGGKVRAGRGRLAAGQRQPGL